MSRNPIACFLLSISLLAAGCGGSSAGTTTPPPTAPSVTSVTPASGGSGAAVSTVPTATFSEAMSATTISASTFTVSGPGGAAVSGSVSYNSTTMTATFTPTANLAYNSLYTVTITTGVTSSSGTALASNYVWSFTTASAPVPPTVTSDTPLTGATDVDIAAAVTATFSQTMSSSTIGTSTFTLTGPGNSAVSGTVSYASTGSVATFTPAANLAYSTLYTATITTGAMDSSGLALAASYTWSFTTEAAPAPPVIDSTTPSPAAAEVAINQALSATFSEAMSASTINSSTFTLTAPGGSSVAGVVAYSSSGNIATFTPSAALIYNTKYTATITTGAMSAAGAAVAADYKWTFTTGTAPTNMATVDFGSSNQTIRGFGGSTAWMPEMSSAQANALFGDNDNDVGLSILRVRIDPNGSAAWGTELGNAQEAQALGAVVIASPWTPPISMKSNGSTVGGSLNTTSYAAYAAYLESFVSYMTAGNVNLYGISMQNEPDANVTYESCFWTPAQMDTWVAQDGSVLTTKLIMPESESFTASYSDSALNDTSAVGNIAIIAGHLYGAVPFYYTNAENKNKDVWMTEHYLSPTGAEPAIGDALASAKEINDSMTVGDYNAYVWWWAADWYASGNSSPATNYGLVDTSNNMTYYGDAMAQFARFVRPGYVRVNATYNPTTNVYLSAYTGSGHYVIVAINMGSSAVSQPFTMANQTVSTLTPYQTSATDTVTQLSAVSVADDMFTYTLPAESITTFVQ